MYKAFILSGLLSNMGLLLLAMEKPGLAQSMHNENLIVRWHLIKTAFKNRHAFTSGPDSVQAGLKILNNWVYEPLELISIDNPDVSLQIRPYEVKFNVHSHAHVIMSEHLLSLMPSNLYCTLLARQLVIRNFIDRTITAPVNKDEEIKDLLSELPLIIKQIIQERILSTSTHSFLFTWRSPEAINYLAQDAKRLYISSSRGNIFQFNKDDYQLVETLQEHPGKIIALAVCQNCLIAGLADYRILVWELNDTAPVQRKLSLNNKENFFEVGVMAVNEKYIVSVTDDNNKVMIRSCDTSDTIWNLPGPLSRCTSLLLKDTKLVSGSCYGHLNIWDLLTGKNIQTWQGHSAAISTLMEDEDDIVSASVDGNIMIWDSVLGVLKCLIKGHKDMIKCLALWDNIIISGSYDQTIRFWNKYTGECIKVASVGRTPYSLVVDQDKNILYAITTNALYLLSLPHLDVFFNKKKPEDDSSGF